jgi:S1-C subfamily serine protease
VAGATAFGVHQAVTPTSVVGQASPALGQSAPAGWVPFHDRNGTGSGSSGSSTGATTTATDAQAVGIVTINTVLQYQSAQAAGTGMVLTSSGEILTNNHVVDGATSVKVTVVSTGTTYTATVVGTDPTADVAVLQLSNASGLQTAKLSSAAATVGESVTGVGNAGGTGTLTAATGTVAAVDQSITASDDNGGNAEQLTGLIQTDAAIQAGDSGGPLYGSSGTVIGMDTAASSGGASEGYAIPITTAESIAKQIESGVDNATIHQGYPAFLGVSVQDGSNGAAVAGLLSGGPAEQAGIVAGDVITAVGGSSITSAGDLSTALQQYNPGDRVTVTWTTATGATQSASVTLATGPAD